MKYRVMVEAVGSCHTPDGSEQTVVQLWKDGFADQVPAQHLADDMNVAAAHNRRPMHPNLRKPGGPLHRKEDKFYVEAYE